MLLFLNRFTCYLQGTLEELLSSDSPQFGSPPKKRPRSLLGTLLFPLPRHSESPANQEKMDEDNFSPQLPKPQQWCFHNVPKPATVSTPRFESLPDKHLTFVQAPEKGVLCKLCGKNLAGNLTRHIIAFHSCNEVLQQNPFLHISLMTGASVSFGSSEERVLEAIHGPVPPALLTLTFETFFTKAGLTPTGMVCRFQGLPVAQFREP